MNYLNLNINKVKKKLTFVKKNLMPIFYSCENSKRGGMEVLVEKYV